MASSGDRARYFLEQSIPELRELLNKEVFTKEEVSSITRKRSEFEHMLNGQGSRLPDYLRYLNYEQSLESLKKKRIQKLGIKNIGYHGPRRTFFLFERATRKFPNDIRLWIQYLNYTKSQKANKRLGKILTTVLRLHPTNSDLWIYAANYAAERNDDPSAARNYFQRALRFCPNDKNIWIEYCRIELLFIERISETIENMGIKKPVTNGNVVSEIENGDGIGNGHEDKSEYEREDEDEQQDENDENNIKLPEVKSAIPESLDTKALKQMALTPALSGHIPITLFDAAMNQFHQDQNLIDEFFDLIYGFPHLSCSRIILEHIIQFYDCPISKFKFDIFGLDYNSFEIYAALSYAIPRIMRSIQQQESELRQKFMADRFIITLRPLLSLEENSTELDNQFLAKDVLSLLAQELEPIGTQLLIEIPEEKMQLTRMSS